MLEAGYKEYDNQHIAFFDFDGTLTTGDTLMPYLKFVVGKPKFYWYLVLVIPILIAYILKLIRNDIAKQMVLKRYLAGYSIGELYQKGELFSKQVIPKMLRDEGIQKLKWHQDQGHSCVLVSASFDVWLEPWAKANGFVDILTTKLETKDGVVTGSISGNNCYGYEKVRRIESWLQIGNRTLSYTYGYGDTAGDIPMLNGVRDGYILKNNKFNKV